MCPVLGVSPAATGGLPSARARVDAELTSRIKLTHKHSRATYGTPRIHAELAGEGIHAGRKRVLD
jgi:putative transposase